MNKLIAILLFSLVPGLLLASSSTISFAPSVGDYSVVFLSNLFGVVDGVLSGTGSQIMGSMFSVLNAAVLALGGLIIMYTLMVSTMNTAHEGQMLGQKWSSIWIPVRATIGLALLIPKASGYCMMQIFVMWIVLQGIGAADAVWGAALGYLNRGGVIIQAQTINPAVDLLNTISGSTRKQGQTTFTAALSILVGQVCMLGLEDQLKNYRQQYIDAQNNGGSSPCSDTPPSSLLCDNSVPDFLSTFDPVGLQEANPNQATPYHLPMPNFPSLPYSRFNGICGSVSWSYPTGIPRMPPTETGTTTSPQVVQAGCSAGGGGAGSAITTSIIQDSTGTYQGCSCTVTTSALGGVLNNDCCGSLFTYHYCTNTPPFTCGCYNEQGNFSLFPPVVASNAPFTAVYGTDGPPLTSSGNPQLAQGVSQNGGPGYVYAPWTVPADRNIIDPATGRPTTNVGFICRDDSTNQYDPPNCCGPTYYFACNNISTNPFTNECYCTQIAQIFNAVINGHEGYSDYNMPYPFGTTGTDSGGPYKGLGTQPPLSVFGTGASATTTVVTTSQSTTGTSSSSTGTAGTPGVAGALAGGVAPGSTGSTGVVVTNTELQLAQESRALALQTMFNSLSGVAQSMVGNAPAFSSYANSQAAITTPASAAWPGSYENEPFGVPYTQNAQICGAYPCFAWGPATGSAALFNGTEFLNAINAYNGVMMPTLQLIDEFNNPAKNYVAATNTAFINQALSQGWIMAGAYFYNILAIQGTNSTATSTTVDDDAAEVYAFTAIALYNAMLGQSQFIPNAVDRSEIVIQINQLINGGNLPKPVIGGGIVAPPTSTIQETNASTVYGYITNSLTLALPGQPGSAKLTFAQSPDFTMGNIQLVPFHYDAPNCPMMNGLSIDGDCLKRWMAFIFMYIIIDVIFQAIFVAVTPIIIAVIQMFVFVPMQGMFAIFAQGVSVIGSGTANPIVALANMGIAYINFSGNLWMTLLGESISSSLIPWIGIFIFSLMTLSMPLLLAWVGTMVSIGFTTAYYIPILPYLIFTFGSIAWLIAVIEAVVAAPIVALGITHPEGHDAFGKGEHAIMILLNVFLRPSMMIIGYIAGIALSYVGVWVLNAGYEQAIGFTSNSAAGSAGGISGYNTSSSAADALISSSVTNNPALVNTGNAFNDTVQNAINKTASSTSAVAASTQIAAFTSWSSMYLAFFTVLTYTTTYLVIVQKSFTLISVLPDKILRWIGGADEHIGQESAQWAQEVQKQHEGASKGTADSQGQMQKQMASGAQSAISKGKDFLGKMGGGSGKIDAGSGGPA